MVVSYTTDAKLMPRVYPQHGEQPLYDAIYNALDAMKEAANPRKALLVITSSGDNGKGENRDQLVNFAIKQPVQIYSLDMEAHPKPHSHWMNWPESPEAAQTWRRTIPLGWKQCPPSWLRH